MTHRSDDEALRARLDERERELRSAKDELEAADQLLWDARKSAEPVPRGESGPVKGAFVLAGAVVAVAIAAGTMGLWIGRTTRSAPSTSTFSAVVDRPGGASGVRSGDRCHVTPTLADGLLESSSIRCGGDVAIDVPRRDPADPVQNEATLDLARGTLEIRVGERADDVLALRMRPEHSAD